jgi:Cu+-exporting ATPase
VLCRTGTVTGGVRRLRAVHAAAGVDADEALRVAGAVAAAAQDTGGVAGSHPVGALVAREARARFGALPGVAEFDGYPGLGVRGVVTELRPGRDDEPRVIAHATLVGRPALLAEHGIALPPDLADAVGRVHAAGATAVAVSWDGVARAVLEVADPPRGGSAEAVRQLHGLGIVPVLLTGDDADAARGLAALLGVAPDRVLAQVARGDRAAAVAALRAQGRTVAVLGGPEDAAALAAADVALLRATDRPDADPADAGGAACALRDGGPLTAVGTLRLARRTARTVERGLTAGAAYHLAVLPAAAAGLLPPLAAAALAAAHPVAALVHAAALRRARPAAPAPH